MLAIGACRLCSVAVGAEPSGLPFQAAVAVLSIRRHLSAVRRDHAEGLVDRRVEYRQQSAAGHRRHGCALAGLARSWPVVSCTIAGVHCADRCDDFLRCGTRNCDHLAGHPPRAGAPDRGRSSLDRAPACISLRVSRASASTFSGGGPTMSHSFSKTLRSSFFFSTSAAGRELPMWPDLSLSRASALIR